VNKTITTSFVVPDQGGLVRINLADTDWIKVGATMRIGFDFYTITQVDQSGIWAIKVPTRIPAGMECLILTDNEPSF